jgi:hypothetical protein
MTKDHSHAHKAESADTEHPELDETTAASAAAPAHASPVVCAAEPVVPVIAVESFGPASNAEPDEPFGITAAFFIDATPLAQKSLEIWEENLNALMAHMENLAGVKTLEDAVALQTRFATDCFENFERQSRDLFALTRQLASAGVAPLCGTRVAA